MTVSQNGWPLQISDSPTLHTWVIPARNGAFKLRLREGSAGFVLAHFALWFAEVVQPVANVADDWGFAPRPIRGSTIPSNHGSGTAMDLNATAHGLGREGTFTGRQAWQIHDRLTWMRGVIRWGGDYQHRKDEMHFEVVQTLAYTEQEARRLTRSVRGRRVLKANPGQKAVIFS